MYEVEFRIPTATYAYVNLKVMSASSKGLMSLLDNMDDELALKLGRTGAALIGAVNHGHANPGAAPVMPDEDAYLAMDAAKQRALIQPDAAELIKHERSLSESDRRGIVSMLGGDPDFSAEELIKSELGGKILKTMPVEAARAASQQEPEGTIQPGSVEAAVAPPRPWNRQPETVQQKPWEAKTATQQPPYTGGLDDFFS
jgi:hypothetical protein